MRLVLFACCDHAIVDSRTNRLSVVNFLDTFRPVSFPVVIPLITLVIWTEREKGDGETDELTAEWKLGRKQVASLPIAIRYQGASKTMTVVEVRSIRIDRPGMLEIALRRGRRRLGHWSLTVEPAAPLTRS